MSIMTESQISNLASAITDQLWSLAPELLNTTQARNYYKLERAIFDIINLEDAIDNAVSDKPNPQGYNIFGTLPTLRLLTKP